MGRGRLGAGSEVVEALGAGPAARSPESPGRLGPAPASAGPRRGCGLWGGDEPETYETLPAADALEKSCASTFLPGDLSRGPQAEWKPGLEVTAP